MCSLFSTSLQVTCLHLILYVIIFKEIFLNIKLLFVFIPFLCHYFQGNICKYKVCVFVVVKIGFCGHLGVLSLRDNHVMFLPSEVGNLRVLSVLDVCGNRLKYLPVTLGACSLKAIWLSENQSQPLLRFQQDVDEETGDKIFTCYLLPQQAYHTASMGWF